MQIKRSKVKKMETTKLPAEAPSQHGGESLAARSSEDLGEVLPAPKKIHDMKVVLCTLGNIKIFFIRALL